MIVLYECARCLATVPPDQANPHPYGRGDTLYLCNDCEPPAHAATPHHEE